MRFKRHTKHYLSLTKADAALAFQALLQFRNKVITWGIDPVDIDRILKRLT